MTLCQDSMAGTNMLTYLSSLQDHTTSPEEGGGRVRNHYADLPDFFFSLHHILHDTGKLCNL